MISSPEYNASMPGVLKNVIDWVSRASPQPFDGHHALLLSASPSMVGGNRSLWSLRVPLEHLGVRVYPGMFSLAQAHTAYDEYGRIADAIFSNGSTTRSLASWILSRRRHTTRASSERGSSSSGKTPDRAVDRVEP